MNEDYFRTPTNVSLLNCYFVSCPKYRWNIFDIYKMILDKYREYGLLNPSEEN